jgi:CRISPR-associated Csx2 family protein
MSTVLATFLGIGGGKSIPGYEETTFDGIKIEGKPLVSCFAQRAIVGHVGVEKIDKVLLLMTKESKDKHRDLLVKELVEAGLTEGKITEVADFQLGQNEQEPWRWFELLANKLSRGDRVVFDFTHGFRAIPIVFATAIDYLVQSKGVVLEHAFYSYLNPTRQDGSGLPSATLLDFADFFRINEWSRAIASMTNSLDSGPLLEIAEKDKSSTFKGLRRQPFLKAMGDLHRGVVNIELNRIGELARTAMDEARASRDKLIESGVGAGREAAVLLGLLIDKFSQLEFSEGSDHFTEEFYEWQSRYIELLVEHGMIQQAFLALNEHLGNFCALVVPEGQRPKSWNTKKGRKVRQDYAGQWLRVCGVPRDNWSDELMSERAYAQMQPQIDIIDKAGLLKKLQTRAEILKDIRNGFAHAWTTKHEVQIPGKRSGSMLVVKPKDFPSIAMETIKEFRDIRKDMVKALGDLSVSRGCS